MSLDLSSLRKALKSLEDVLGVLRDKAFIEGLSAVQHRGFEAGVIQNFEFSYELCWKFIQRWIQVHMLPDDAAVRTRKELFRIAAQKGLIEDPQRWFDYADARNLTSHTYDEPKAQEVLSHVEEFYADARYLLEQLERLND